MKIKFITKFITKFFTIVKDFFNSYKTKLFAKVTNYLQIKNQFNVGKSNNELEIFKVISIEENKIFKYYTIKMINRSDVRDFKFISII